MFIRTNLYQELYSVRGQWHKYTVFLTLEDLEEADFSPNKIFRDNVVV